MTKRLDDSISSLNAIDMLDIPIHFICRIPADISTLADVENDVIKYKGKTFNFLDIRAFVRSSSAMLSTVQMASILAELRDFVSQIDRPMTTKNGWNSIFD